jgi:Subtilase family
VAAGVAAGVCGAAAPAWGEVGAPGATVQAIAADAQFLEYAPPPAAPGVVCLVDSGVDANPDTTPILAGSYALEPGTDTSDELSKLNPPLQPGNHPDGHGTYMAMLMAAPVNGWGMVGIAPTSVRVFNLKALAAGESTFSFFKYSYAASHCLSGPTGVTGITVINLSLGSGTQPTAPDLADLADTVAAAHLQGFNVVAAAGNDAGTVAYPAATSGILAVGATDANPSNLGVLCQFSNRGIALAILAPGCGSQAEAGGGGGGLDVAFSDDGTPAWSYGTSQAAAVVSAVLASMRAYGPALTEEQAESCLTSTTTNGGNLDAAAAFRACGLASVVSQGMAAYEAATAPSAAPVPPAQATTASKVPDLLTSPIRPRPPRSARPRILSLRVRGGHLTVSVAKIPRGARLRLDAERKAGTRYRTVASRTTNRRVATVTAGRWDRVAVAFVRAGKESAKAYAARPRATASALVDRPSSLRRAE